MRKNLDKESVSDKSRIMDKTRLKIMKGGDPRQTGGMTAFKESQRGSTSVLD